MKRLSAILATLAACAMLASPTPAAPTTGNPKIESIEAMCFGPDGLLFIGDGKSGQVVAIHTGDTTPIEWSKIDGGDFKERVGKELGTNAKGVEILKLIVNPASHRAYVSVRRLSDKRDLILTVDGSGTIRELPLDKVKHSSYALSASDKAPVVKITDITFAEGRILLAVQAKDQFASQIFTIDTRQDDSAPVAIRAETYHVAHGRWETNAPIRTLIPYTEGGKKYLVGAFTCTPIVKYSLDEIKAGANVKGTSVIELGHGNTPQDMFVYEKNDKTYILMNHTRSPKFGKIGSSPFWTAKVEHGILAENEAINEKAIVRAPRKADPNATTTQRAVVVPEFQGVAMMDRLDADRALVLRSDDKGGLSLAVLPLP